MKPAILPLSSSVLSFSSPECFIRCGILKWLLDAVNACACLFFIYLE